MSFINICLYLKQQLKLKYDILEDKELYNMVAAIYYIHYLK